MSLDKTIEALRDKGFEEYTQHKPIDEHFNLNNTRSAQNRRASSQLTPG